MASLNQQKSQIFIYLFIYEQYNDKTNLRQYTSRVLNL